MNPVTVQAWVLAGSLLVLGCNRGGSSGSSGSSGASSSSASAPLVAGGFDCQLQNNRRTAANCPKYAGAKFLSDCQDTKKVAGSACKTQLDAFGACVQGQPVGCTDAGDVDNVTPPSCKPAGEALSACITRNGQK